MWLFNNILSCYGLLIEMKWYVLSLVIEVKDEFYSVSDTVIAHRFNSCWEKLACLCHRLAKKNHLSLTCYGWSYPLFKHSFHWCQMVKKKSSFSPTVYTTFPYLVNNIYFSGKQFCFSGNGNFCLPH